MLVDHAAQTVGASYPGRVGVADGGGCRMGISGRSLAEGPVAPMRVWPDCCTTLDWGERAGV